MPRLLTPLILSTALAAGAPVHAQEPRPPVYDRVHLAASAGREVDTDLLVAELFKEHQSAVQATAADEVNRAVTWALELARGRGVSAQPTSYRTQPVYQKQHIQGWRVYQSIRLESDDGEALAGLLGDLQQRLSIQSLSNTLSPQARARTEEQLVVEALEAFQARAGVIARTLGRSGHRIVEISVDTQGGGRPMPVMMRAAAASADVAVAPPSVDGGTLRVEIQVSGTVELNAGP